ncbi:MAG: hypothetical protein ISS57_15625 [Anaerolineales bacterium]|nr:hypothetical protein [Anaerolineales bacterium]
MDMKSLGKWFYLVGIVVAMLASLLVFSANWLTWVLMLLGVLAGIFYADTDDVVNRGIRYLALAAVAGSLGGFIFVGPYITGLVTGAVTFLGPVLLTSLAYRFWKVAFGK